MALRYIVPGLAAAGLAAAACSGTTTIQNSGDAMALSTCLTYSGDIAIATGTTGDIAIDGVRRISGSLTAKNTPNMTSLSGDSLSQIDDSFTLNNVQILTSLGFPALASVDTIDWSGVPNLQGLSFSTGLSKVANLGIQNTGLSSLEGIDLDMVDIFFIANNNYLTDISMPLAYVTNALSISSNGRDVHVSFPDMKWANNMTFRNVSSVSVPSLGSTNGSLGFISNYFQSISAPNLTVVGQSLAFVSNGQLTNISFPELVQVTGGLQVANNTHLAAIDGFPRLQRVGGAVDFNGEFTDVSLPKINDVRGGFNIQSTKSLGSVCSHFRALSGPNNDIKGTFTCKGGLSHPGGSGTLKPGTSSSSGASSSSSGAANPMLIPGATGLLGVVAAIFGVL